MSDIVKNCPALRGWVCNEQFIRQDKMVACQDCANCILKQIVELCFKARQECNCSDIIPEVDCVDCTEGGMSQLASEILDLLEIEECE